MVAQKREHKGTKNKMSEKVLDFDSYGTDLGKMASREEIEKPKRGSRNPAAWMKLEPDNDYDLRILPGDPEAEGEWKGMPYIRTWQHFRVGPSENDRCLCPSRMSECVQRCYICEQIDELNMTGDKVDEQRAGKMKPGQSFIYQVIDRADPIWIAGDHGIEDKTEMIGKPKIKFLRLPWSAHSQLLDYYADPEYGDLSHPISGLDVKVSRTGCDLNTRYGVKTKRKNSPMFETVAGDPDVDLITEAINSMHSLPTHPFFKIPTYDETVAAMMGTNPEEHKEIDNTGRVTAQLPTSRAASIEGWEELVTSERHGQAPPVAMTVSEVAKWGGWEVDEVKEATPCYGKEPDHTDKICLDCPIKAPCANIFHDKTGKYSMKAPDPEKPKLGGKKKNGDDGEESKESSTGGMKDFLKEAGAKS